MDRRGLESRSVAARCVSRSSGRIVRGPPKPCAGMAALGGQGSAGRRARTRHVLGALPPPGARPPSPFPAPCPSQGWVDRAPGAAHAPSASWDPRPRAPRAPSPPAGRAHWLPLPLPLAAAAAAGIVFVVAEAGRAAGAGSLSPGRAPPPPPAQRPRLRGAPLSANIPEIKRYAAAAAAAGPGAGGAGDRGEAAPAAAMEALGPGEKRARAGAGIGPRDGWVGRRGRGSPAPHRLARTRVPAVRPGGRREPVPHCTRRRELTRAFRGRDRAPALQR